MDPGLMQWNALVVVSALVDVNMLESSLVDVSSEVVASSKA